jgi:DNA-binding FadR family transcriptional regulator
MMPIIPSERPHEAVARRLRDAILDGTYAPGDRLPVERQLSESFQVSRSAVRQALLILDQQGLVRVKPGQGGGPFVSREPVPAAVTAFQNLVNVDDASVGEFVQAKILIEPAMAAFAAATISETDLGLLEENLARTRDAAERGEDIVNLSVEFHSIIFRSTRNRFMEVLLQVLDPSFVALPASMLSSAHQHFAVDDHAELLSAFRRGAAAEVRELMEKHLERVWQDELQQSKLESSAG